MISLVVNVLKNDVKDEGFAVGTILGVIISAHKITYKIIISN
jgi:hypothetical protein